MTKPKPLWQLVQEHPTCPECGHGGGSHFRLDGVPICENVTAGPCACRYDYLKEIGYTFIPVTV